MADPLVWLDPDAVRRWYSGSSDAPTGVDDETLTLVIAACAEFCQRSRNDLPWESYTNPVQVPAEVRQAGVMLAGRMLRRRNSMGGVDTFQDGSIAYVSRHDPDIDRALRQGAWSRPADRVSIYAAALEWQQRFRDADIACALDQRDLVLPGVLIDPPTLVFKYAGVADAEWVVYLLTVDAGTLPALAQLDALIARVFPVIQGHTQEGTVIRLTVGGGQAVGYRFSWTQRITVGDLDLPTPEPEPTPEPDPAPDPETQE